MAGVTIKVNADMDKLERDLAVAEKELSNHVDNYNKIAKSVEIYTDTLDETKHKIQENEQELQKWKALQDSINNGTATYSQMQQYNADTSVGDRLLQQKNSLIKAQEELNSKIDSENSKLAKSSVQIEKAKNKVKQIDMKRVANDTKKAEASMKSMKGAVGGVASGTEKAIRSVGKWALAIFGVRSAYNLLRQASSNLASYDEQYATNLEYIKFVLTQAIAPVLRYIVNLAMTLLSYLNAILGAWFGLNLFSNATAKDFQNMKASAGATAKSAKEIKNQLTGFDEMNVLSDNSSSSGGGGGGAVAPSMDLSKMQGEPPTWLKWIIDHKDEIMAILFGALAGVIALKAGLGGIKSLGIGMMVAGIIGAIRSVIEYLKDPSWENFGNTLIWIGIAVVGLGLTIGSLPVAVVGACILIVGIVAKYWEQIKSTLQGGIDWLESKSGWVHYMFGDFIGGIYDMFVTELQYILNEFDNTMTTIKGVFDGIVNFIAGIFTGDWDRAWQGLVTIVGTILGSIVTRVRNKLEKITNIFGIFGDMAGDSFGGGLRSGIQTAVREVQKLINKVIDQFNKVIDKLNQLPNVNLSRITKLTLADNDAKGTAIGRYVKMPQLATGAILNNPGRGVMVGGGTAIAGEAGAEGIIPLTDESAMETLGQTIGRHVTINASIINKMNNRVISREIQRVQASQEFAYNT